MISTGTSDPILVLSVANDSTTTRALTELECGTDDFDVLSVSHPEDALDRLERTTVDCIVSEYRLEPIDGLDLLESVREVDPTLPFFLVVDEEWSDELTDRAISADVTDYIRARDDETWFPIVANRIETAVRTYRQELELERYRLMIETVPDGVYALDDEFVYQFANQSMADLLGYDRDVLEGSHVSLINDEDAIDRAQMARERALSREDPIEIVYNDHITANGKRIPCEVQFRAIESDGTFQGTVGVLRDISDRIEREEELERQNDRLREFASIVSHDLRSPLSTAVGHLELVMADRDDTPSGGTGPGTESESEREHAADDNAGSLEEARRALGRMENLIEDLLELARQGRTIDDPEPVTLGSVLETALVTTDTTDATVETDPEIDSVTVHGDSSRLRQVFDNLIRNAVEHGSTNCSLTDTREDVVEGRARRPADRPTLEEDGSTSRSVADGRENGSAEHGSSRRQDGDGGDTRDPEREPGPEDVVTIRIGTLEDETGNTNGFYVEDDGPGIPDSERDCVFDSGYTTSEKGTGFGLRIVEEIVEAHGWKIHVTDGTDGGARFEIVDIHGSADCRSR